METAWRAMEIWTILFGGPECWEGRGSSFFYVRLQALHCLCVPIFQPEETPEQMPRFSSPLSEAPLPFPSTSHTWFQTHPCKVGPGDGGWELQQRTQSAGTGAELTTWLEILLSLYCLPFPFLSPNQLFCWKLWLWFSSYESFREYRSLPCNNTFTTKFFFTLPSIPRCWPTSIFKSWNSFLSTLPTIHTTDIILESYFYYYHFFNNILTLC